MKHFKNGCNFTQSVRLHCRISLDLIMLSACGVQFSRETNVTSLRRQCTWKQQLACFQYYWYRRSIILHSSLKACLFYHLLSVQLFCSLLKIIFLPTSLHTLWNALIFAKIPEGNIRMRGNIPCLSPSCVTYTSIGTYY